MADDIRTEMDAVIKTLDKSNEELLAAAEKCKKIQEENRRLLDEMRKQRQHDNEVFNEQLRLLGIKIDNLVREMKTTEYKKKHKKIIVA